MRAIYLIIPSLAEATRESEKAPAVTETALPEKRRRRSWSPTPVRTARSSRFTVRQWPAPR